MTPKRESLKGEMKFTAEYAVEGIGDRDIPHGKNGARYRPDRVTIVLVSSSAYFEDKLSISSLKLNMSISHVTVSGSRLKKNGHPGIVACKEVFYSGRHLPEWVQSLTGDLMWEVKRL